MEHDKNNKNYFLRTIYLLFILFITLYSMNNLGYYNIDTKNKVITEEKMKEFERDIKNGKKIDIKKYTKDETNYKNIYSNIGYESSKLIDNLLNKGFNKIIKKLLQ